MSSDLIGVLVVNLGTPDAPDTPAVRRYLRQFLSDPRVLDIPAPARWLLLNLVILPFRPARSAEQYRRVWTGADSPLRLEGEALVEGLRRELGAGHVVELGMRYGRPSLPTALEALRAARVTRLVVLPLYPQFTSSSSGSSLQLVYETLAARWDVPAVSVVPPFFAESSVLDGWRESLRPHLDAARAEHVLFSFHGLPERHLLKSREETPGSACRASESCCAALTSVNAHCYRAQCFETARQLARRLDLREGTWSVSFQSRLGRTPWIAPYTDHVLRDMAARGVKRVAVCCPGFVADCLETLEEIALREAERFREAGGEALALLPSLNAHPAWVRAAAGLVRKAYGVNV